MKRRAYLLLPLVALLAATGCQTTSEPERGEVLGSWATLDVPGTVVRMTLAETSRSVDGAGAWIDQDASTAFVVRGALARDEIALNFDFPGEPAMNFQGYFAEEDLMTGTLNGRGLRDVAVSFTRQDLVD